MGWESAAIGAAGSVLGGALGGKKSGGSKAPKWLRQGAKQLAAQGQTLGQTPYTPYGGERVAGFSPDTMAAFDMIRNNVGAATPAYQNAMAASQGLTNFEAPQVTASQWAGQDLSPYMNPYIQSVIDAQAADQQNAYGQAYNNLASQAQAGGAFGGSRFGVAQGQLSADSVRNQALISAQLRSQGFDTAAGLLSDDVTRQNAASALNQNASIQSGFLRGQAAGQLGNLAGEYQNSLGADASALGAAGAAQQALAQQQLDVNYGNYWDQTRAYPTQQMNWWSGSLQPGIAASAQNQPATGGGLLGALGGAQIGGQVGNSVYDWWKNGPPRAPTGGNHAAGTGSMGSGGYA